MTNQSRPLFNIGEEVIICCQDNHKLNGMVSRVTLISEAGSTYQCPHTSNLFYEVHPRRYVLEVLNELVESNVSGQFDRGFRESSLRKRYPPSSQSFSELMSSLKTPDKLVL